MPSFIKLSKLYWNFRNCLLSLTKETETLILGTKLKKVATNIWRIDMYCPNFSKLTIRKLAQREQEFMIHPTNSHTSHKHENTTSKSVSHRHLLKIRHKTLYSINSNSISRSTESSKNPEHPTTLISALTQIPLAFSPVTPTFHSETAAECISLRLQKEKPLSYRTESPRAVAGWKIHRWSKKAAGQDVITSFDVSQHVSRVNYRFPERGTIKYRFLAGRAAGRPRASTRVAAACRVPTWCRAQVRVPVRAGRECVAGAVYGACRHTRTTWEARTSQREAQRSAEERRDAGVGSLAESYLLTSRGAGVAGATRPGLFLRPPFVALRLCLPLYAALCFCSAMFASVRAVAKDNATPESSVAAASALRMPRSPGNGEIFGKKEPYSSLTKGFADLSL